MYCNGWKTQFPKMEFSLLKKKPLVKTQANLSTVGYIH